MKSHLRLNNELFNVFEFFFKFPAVTTTAKKTVQKTVIELMLQFSSQYSKLPPFAIVIRAFCVVIDINMPVPTSSNVLTGQFLNQ
jgi:hypothetical protein